MFAEALTALAAFAQEATGQPASVGRPGSAGIALTAPAGGEAAAAEQPADDAAGVVTLHLVSIARTERFQNREPRGLARPERHRDGRPPGSRLVRPHGRPRGRR